MKKNSNNSRRFAITDIHGCLKSFQALLQKIEFSKRDQLYLLGDYINRGSQSKGVIDYIWQLQVEGFSVNCLSGNHEIRAVSNYDSYHFERLFKKPGKEAFNKSLEIANAGETPIKYVDWMCQLPPFLEIDGYILVHAGLGFKTENPLENLKAMSWIRNWYDNIDYQWLGNRIILHGHSPIVKSKMEAQLQRIEKQRVLNLDCGCVVKNKEGKGYLAAFDLDKQELIFQECLTDIFYNTGSARCALEIKRNYAGTWTK